MARKKNKKLPDLINVGGSPDVTPQPHNIINLNLPSRRNNLSMKRRKQRYQPADSNVVNFDQARADSPRKPSRVNIVPRNTKQEEYVDHLENDKKRIVFATGPAGTGKTLLATMTAIKAFKEGVVDKIIITRPAVEVADEKLGFLPGTLEEKMAPWTRPIFDIFYEYFTKKDVTRMLEEGTLEISPLAFMRGRTFKNAYILADEMQNTTPEQMKMLLTRIGENTRCLITGDPVQTDIRGKNGLNDFIEKLESYPNRGIAVVYFERNHVERDPIVGSVLAIYGEYE